MDTEVILPICEKCGKIIDVKDEKGRHVIVITVGDNHSLIPCAPFKGPLKGGKFYLTREEAMKDNPAV